MNDTKYQASLFAGILLFIAISSNAQQLKFPSDLGNQMNLYAKKKQAPVLFVHFDKNVYTANENVWFTAYLMNYTDASLYHVLSLALVRDADRAVVMENRFMIHKGVCYGSTFIPDTIAPDNYTFLATTNRLVNGKPEMVFAQPITIKTLSEPAFTASLGPLDTAATKAEQKVILSVGVPGLDLKNKKIPPQVSFRYYLGSSARPLLHGEGKTSATHIFTIPSELLAPDNNLLHVQLCYNDETRDLSMALPARQRPAVVGFFPEGGNLVNDLPCTVGLEVRTAAGMPLGTSVFLLDGTKVIDTLRTDSYGLGRFTLTPKAGHSYSLKLYNVNKKDTAYLLPQPLVTGPTLSINNAVVNDTLMVTIRDKQREKLYLTGHNYQELFFTQMVNITDGIKRLNLAISSLPKGLVQLTLTDSLGRPYAERLFFAHYNKREPVKITTDKGAYTTRQKVNMKMKLDASLPDSGWVSVACVQENRLSLGKKTNIENYFYLQHSLDELPLRESYLQNAEGDKTFLENILLIKGWSRYSWTDILKTRPADTLKQYSYLTFAGRVTWIADPPPPNAVKGEWLGEPIKHSVNVVNLANPLNIITTNNAGNFTLADSTVITTPGKPVSHIVIGKDSKEYKIVIEDPYVSLNKMLASRTMPVDRETGTRENSRYLEVPQDEHAHLLREVAIKGNNDDNGFFNLRGRNACGDYVCRYGYFNCFTHRNESDNRPPVIGETYLLTDGIHPKTIVYQGCTVVAGKPFKGIYAAQEFYPADYGKENSSVPDYLSTVYWNYRVRISSLKDTGISFNTSDIIGRYKIVVQGITGNDVTYGEAGFNVVKPK